MPDLTRLHRLGCAARARGVLWLALLALTLRALVPTGYMPDVRALHDGRLQVTFCSAAGDLSTLSLALANTGGGEKPEHDGAKTGAQCPFGLLAHIAPAPTPALTPMVLPAGQYVPPPPAYRALPALAAQGPPLGSRAPPFLA
ncbi:DUF2946 family protein [Achromobacter pestifer]|uniref:DUF2946 domain-containing protein n=1 Tax=Achromobacter pestifer TaxID=1353889 RepID=A0A6S6ZZ94_9BURK|nr:DUF2946 family protein [Achromobacter pestifer]CAB3693624.1 hypothetical protein LMG3431_05009 [Achromobacter pestifer]